MAALKKSPEFLETLKRALADSLKEAGIEARISSERVPGTKLHRVWVLAPRFGRMMHPERQNFVWRIAKRAISPDDQMRISMIVTLTDEEAGLKPPSPRRARASSAR